MKMMTQLSLLAIILCSQLAIVGADEVRTIPVKFKPGTSGAELKGSVTGRETIIYKLNARDGQFLQVDLSSENLSTHFNIYVPGKGPGAEALYTSATGDKSYTGQLYKTGDHSISVFLYRNAARRGEKADFTLSVRVTDEAPADTKGKADTAKFSKKVDYDEISFTVTSPAKDQGNQFTIASKGLSEVNDAITIDINGKVIDVLCDDIDGDNSPEAAVIIEGEDHKRIAHVFSSYSRKSFGMVNFQDITDAKQLSGYRGGDEFQFVENSFIRRIPLHADNQKTGKFRQFQFKMENGEAMKQLKLQRTTDF